MSLNINNINNSYSFKGRIAKINKNRTKSLISTAFGNKKAVITGTNISDSFRISRLNDKNITEKIISVTKEKVTKIKSNIRKFLGKISWSTKEAEQASKINPETGLEAQQTAKKKADLETLPTKLNAKEEFEQKLISDFDKNYDLSIGEKSLENYPQELNKADAFETGIVGTLKKAEKEGLKKKQVKKLYKTITKKHIISDETIEERAKKAPHLRGNERILTRHDLKDRKRLIIDLSNMQKTVPQKDDELYSDYIDRLINKRKTELETQREKHIEHVRAKIHYEDIDPEEPELTDKEMKALTEWQPDIYGRLSKRDAQARLSVNNHSWMKGYTSEEKDGGLPENIETILLEKTFPKYNSEKFYENKAFAHKPVARWINVSGGKNCRDYDIDRYINETFKVGGKYTVPAKQSCSTDLYSANDADFCDEGYKEVKFIIHPMSKTSRAADLSEYARALRTRYGHTEVVYPKGTEFNVLDKRLEKVVHKNGTFVYRWIIEMQEAPVVK